MAIKNVNGIKIHQYLIFSLIDSGIINAKKVKHTTFKSAPKDFPAKFCYASWKKPTKVAFSTELKY